MKRVSSAFYRRTGAAVLGATALLAGVAALRAAQTTSREPAACDVSATAPACCVPTGSAVASAPSCCAPAAPSQSAMRVEIDPETGILGVPADGLDKSLALPEAKGALPPVEVRADGSEVLHVQGHFRNFSLVRVGADGRIETGCTTDGGTARQFLRGTGDAAAIPLTVPAPGSVVQPLPVEVK